MGRPRRIRRRLTLHVSERQPENPNETWTPGQRFATGWQRRMTAATVEACNGDPVQIAGFLAANDAWQAHSLRHELA
jgi:hypothetical protein